MTAAAPHSAEPAAGREARRPGDPAAFRRLYDEHAGFVQYVASRAGARGGEADDVVQETFMRLWRQDESIDPSKLKAWLATTARRLVIDFARKRKHERDDTTAIEQAAQPEDDEARERDQDVAVVRALLDELEQEPGGVSFKMFYVEGLTARAIAEKNGEAVSTVTTRLSRFRERFRDRLKRRMDELRSGKVTKEKSR